MGSPTLLTANRFSSAGSLTASSLGTTVTAHASSNTKGSSYTELIATTAHAAKALLIQNSVSSNGEFLIDIAIGAAASEQIIIADLGYHTEQARHSAAYALIPIAVPAGVRLSARCQSTVGANVVRMNVTLIEGGVLNPGSFNRVATYGANTADSGGVSVDPGASINTKGDYSEIAATTTFQHDWIVICIGGQANTARTSYQWLMDVAIGAAASEQIIIPNLIVIGNSPVDMMQPQYISIPCSIPAGSRLAVRAQCGGNDATDRLFDVHILGVG